MLALRLSLIQFLLFWLALLSNTFQSLEHLEDGELVESDNSDHLVSETPIELQGGNSGTFYSDPTQGLEEFQAILSLSLEKNRSLPSPRYFEYPDVPEFDPVLPGQKSKSLTGSEHSEDQRLFDNSCPSIPIDSIFIETIPSSNTQPLNPQRVTRSSKYLITDSETGDSNLQKKRASYSKKGKKKKSSSR